MKYKCPECGEIHYRDEDLESCPNCDSVLEDVSPKADMASCPVTGETTRSVRGIPDCDQFKLTNAIGFRCTQGKLPGACESCGLPFYSPRVGVSEK